MRDVTKTIEKLDKLISKKENALHLLRNSVTSNNKYYELMSSRLNMQLARAYEFKRELKNVLDYEPYRVVQKKKLKKILIRADFTELEFDGNFVKIYCVGELPYMEEYLVTISSFDKIFEDIGM